MIVRASRMSVMHTTTQQCVKHYGGHRRVGEKFVKHDCLVLIRTIGVIGLIVVRDVIGEYPPGLYRNLLPMGIAQVVPNRESLQIVGKRCKISPQHFSKMLSN